MPESIIMPTIDPSFDLVRLNPFQAFLLPYEMWWSLFLWIVFAALLSYQIFRYLIAPYLHETR